MIEHGSDRWMGASNNSRLKVSRDLIHRETIITLRLPECHVIPRTWSLLFSKSTLPPPRRDQQYRIRGTVNEPCRNGRDNLPINIHRRQEREACPVVKRHGRTLTTSPGSLTTRWRYTKPRRKSMESALTDFLFELRQQKEKKEKKKRRRKKKNNEKSWRVTSKAADCRPTSLDEPFETAFLAYWLGSSLKMRRTNGVVRSNRTRGRLWDIWLEGETEGKIRLGGTCAWENGRAECGSCRILRF